MIADASPYCARYTGQSFSMKCPSMHSFGHLKPPGVGCIVAVPSLSCFARM